MKNYVYVDAENVAYPDFKGYFDKHLSGTVVCGKAYGSQGVVGESSMDFIRLGFDFIDTSKFSMSSKNVADMKILTDCAFDITQLTDMKGVSVTLITKDCDFLPLVYKLMSTGVHVNVPFMGKEQSTQVSMTAITEAMTAHGYDPFASGEWLEPQVQVLQELLREEFDSTQIVAFCSRKRSRFVRALAVGNPLLAASLNRIPDAEFGVTTIVAEMQRAHYGMQDLCECISLYTGKYFGVLRSNKFIRMALKDVLSERR